jgi:hypothetical protein
MFLRYLSTSLALTGTLIACSPHADTSARQTEAPRNRSVTERHNGLAMFCVVDGVSSPPSYLVRDIGKPDVPKLTAAQLAMVRKIRVYVHPTTLRFANVAGEFIVFDASRGPCETSAPGYSVLNGACNEMYSPTDNFDGTRAVPGCWNAPRPWIVHDSGRGTTPWTAYDNNH